MESYALIMSGGRGKRFWPLSQVTFPKQFLNFTGEESLFAQTFQNLRHLMPAKNIFTVTRQAYRAIVLEQVKEFVPENIIVEPIQNNTAPCVALGVSHVLHNSPDSVIVVLPADHFFDDRAGFVSALKTAMQYVQENSEILTFGIKPDFPHTGYGYIQTGETLKVYDQYEIYRGEQFVEKPNLETARSFLDDSHYYWNAGIFCARSTVFLDAFRQYLPVIYKNIRDFQPHIGTFDENRKLLEVYDRMPKISFDYGIMEYTHHLAVMPIDVGWNDVGTWSSLRRLHGVNDPENMVLGKHLVVDASGSTIVGDGKVVVVGVDNVIVASNGGYVLVCARDKEHHIQDVVDQLENNGQHDR
ncbi:MAG: mannose-1-phosphate guanylyltransferase [Chloroflexota bacterium]